MNDLVREAMLNPQLAQVLLARVTPKSRANVAASLAATLNRMNVAAGADQRRRQQRAAPARRPQAAVQQQVNPLAMLAPLPAPQNTLAGLVGLGGSAVDASRLDELADAGVGDVSDPWNPPPEPVPVLPAPMPPTAIRDGSHQGVRWWVTLIGEGVPFVTLAANAPYVFRVEDCAGWTVADVQRLVEAELAAVAKRASRKAISIPAATAPPLALAAPCAQPLRHWRRDGGLPVQSSPHRALRHAQLRAKGGRPPAQRGEGAG